MSYFIVDDSTKIIINSIVINENTIQSGWAPPNGHSLISYEGFAGIGWIWNGINATDPNPSPPVTPRPPVKTLAEQILSDPVELAKLKTALGL